MLKRMLLCCVLFSFASFLVAGDVAAFIDEGFSNDGKIYVFGQYGSVDKTWQGYAEIYTVDIAENDYVDGAVFTTPASSKTQGKNGHTLYTDLRDKHASYLDDLQLKSVGIDNVLYIKSSTNVKSGTRARPAGARAPTDGKDSYAVSITPWYSGSTPSSQSSFFIAVEKYNENGDLIGKQIVGNPDIKRRGVIDYGIEKILKSPDGKSFIFVIEKTIATANGNSIRYMVETLEIDNFGK